ncbi:hypothetical protein B0T21DRAFT_434002 [Apiosordaria backusii]|uniref:Uncharacterized protein n=1 Tax=Apiosordaria backusii TaxID=314023 RepID=A0AA40EMQ0_9PEZI|nr:hypothetical protein B0T21DRAFT_434002 [Apiosordaria backusii]
MDCSSPLSDRQPGAMPTWEDWIELYLSRASAHFMDGKDPVEVLTDYGKRYIVLIHAHLQEDEHVERLLTGCGEPLVQLLTRQARAMNQPRPDFDRVKRRLDDILAASYNKFYAYLYKDLPLCWRVIYTEAAILKFWLLWFEWARSQRPEMFQPKEWERKREWYPREHKQQDEQLSMEQLEEWERQMRQQGEWPPSIHVGGREKEDQIYELLRMKQRQDEQQQLDEHRQDEHGPEQHQQKQQQKEQLLNEMIKTLDLALILAGGGEKRDFINRIIALLEKAVSPHCNDNPYLPNPKPENEDPSPSKQPEASTRPTKRPKLSPPPPPPPNWSSHPSFPPPNPSPPQSQTPSPASPPPPSHPSNSTSPPPPPLPNPKSSSTSSRTGQPSPPTPGPNPPTSSPALFPGAG